MVLKEQILSSIIDSIFKLDSPKIDESRKTQISNFVISTINGDIPDDYLAINANFSENNKGATVFILTNLRLIKIDIAPKEIKSSSFPLNTIIGIDRKIVNDDRAEFNISFQNGSFGLRYPQDDQSITDFFQKVDQKRYSIGAAFFYINKVNDKTDAINDRLIRVETKLEIKK